MWKRVMPKSPLRPPVEFCASSIPSSKEHEKKSKKESLVNLCFVCKSEACFDVLRRRGIQFHHHLSPEADSESCFGWFARSRSERTIPPSPSLTFGVINLSVTVETISLPSIFFFLRVQCFVQRHNNYSLHNNVDFFFTNTWIAW